MGGLTHVTGLCYPAVDLKPGLFWQPHLLFHGLPPDGRGVSSFPMWRSWALFLIPLALACSVRYFKQGSFPRFCCAHPCLCPFLACSLRAAALQPSIYMALICLSLFGTYMAPIGPGAECPPIFNIFIFTRADAHAYLWGQEVPLLLLYRWRTLNGNWLNWEQVVVQEGCIHMVQKMASRRDGLSATVQCWERRHECCNQGTARSHSLYPCSGLFNLESCFKNQSCPCDTISDRKYFFRIAQSGWKQRLASSQFDIWSKWCFNGRILPSCSLALWVLEGICLPLFHGCKVGMSPAVHSAAIGSGLLCFVRTLWMFGS